MSRAGRSHCAEYSLISRCLPVGPGSAVATAGSRYHRDGTVARDIQTYGRSLARDIQDSTDGDGAIRSPGRRPAAAGTDPEQYHRIRARCQNCRRGEGGGGGGVAHTGPYYDITHTGIDPILRSGGRQCDGGPRAECAVFITYQLTTDN